MRKKPEIDIAGRKIGENYPPLVIAEIGINHKGDIKKAKKMVLDAHKAGAECVKFQSHILKDEMIPEAKKVIPANTNKSIWEVMEEAVLTEKEEIELKKYVEKLGMIYLCTPFSRAAANRLKKMKVKAYKIGSGECNNYPLIEHIASFGKPVILSTGMNDFKSISKSVAILRRYKIPFSLLHCVSMYPTPYNKVKLGVINKIKKKFPDAVVGLSDHSLGNYTCFGAVSYGASILEKHFVSNKKWSGPDVAISLGPRELKDLIVGTQVIHKALGDIKEILPEEKSTIDFAYASVVSTKHIKKGEVLSKDNIWVKRPGTGEIKASDFKKMLGKKAKTNIGADVFIKWKHIFNDGK